MGSGKTTVGKLLAKSLSLEFIDLDVYIENKHRKSIATLFEEKGEEMFRRIESQALQEVADAGLSQKSLAGRLAKAEEAVEAASEAHRVARNRYEGGLSSYLEVLSAEDVLLSSLRSLTDLQSRAFSLDVALMRALGGGYREAPAATNESNS